MPYGTLPRRCVNDPRLGRAYALRLRAQGHRTPLTPGPRVHRNPCSAARPATTDMVLMGSGLSGWTGRTANWSKVTFQGVYVGSPRVGVTVSSSRTNGDGSGTRFL